MVSEFFVSYPVYSLLSVSVVMSFMTSLIYRLFGNYKELKRLKAELNDLRESVSKAQKEKNEKKVMELLKKQNSLAMEQFQYMFKPMFLTMGLVGLVFMFLKKIYVGMDLSFGLPFSLPFIGNSVGWLGFYIIMTLPLTIFFRKLMKLD